VRNFVRCVATDSFAKADVNDLPGIGNCILTCARMTKTSRRLDQHRKFVLSSHFLITEARTAVKSRCEVFIAGFWRVLTRREGAALLSKAFTVTRPALISSDAERCAAQWAVASFPASEAGQQTCMRISLPAARSVRSCGPHQHLHRSSEGCVSCFMIAFAHLQLST